MPTPLSVARQCLTPDAARALDDAADAAKRRAHAQTTSLHAVAALLAATAAAPVLRDACARARSAAFSHRLQLRALDLCFSAALDRVPSSAARPPDDAPPPPVSNSLMAAVKRSQAIQRRTSGHYHNQPLPEPASTPVVKVELRQLVLSILDDPVVSRVFADAGFGSADVKLAILRPAFSDHYRRRAPPLFLCNFAPAIAAGDGLVDDTLWRVAEVLTRKPRRNPLLVGAAAREAAAAFKKWFGSPSFTPELAGLRFVSVENEVAAGSLSPMLRAEVSAGGGLVVGIGGLEDFPADERGEEIAKELSGLLGGEFAGRVWLVGSATTYEVYMRFVNRLEVVEKEWDLQLLPINSIKNGLSLKQRPSSLMESFVPFGGSFPLLSDIKFSFAGVPISRCTTCDEKYEQEVMALEKGVSPLTGLPFWNRKTDFLSMFIEQDTAKANKCALFTRILVLQKKWNDICQHHHHQNNRFPDPNAYLMSPASLNSENFGISQASIEERRVGDHTNNILDSCQGKIGLPKQKISSSLEVENLTLKADIKCSGEDIFKEDSESGSCKNLSSNDSKNCTSWSSVTTVNTDLMLGTHSSPLDIYQNENTKGLDDCTLLSSTEFCSKSKLKHSSSINSGTGSFQMAHYQDLMYISKQSIPEDLKSLWRSLCEKVGRQQEALYAISQTISYFKSGTMRRNGTSIKGDIWLSLVGPDKYGKKRAVNALTELICGSRDKLIHVDLNSQQSATDVWRQTVVGYIVNEISKKPVCVVFLENVDRADVVLQNNLTWAVETGKFKDSCGRQVGLSNTIFVTTVEKRGAQNATPEKLGPNFTEEKVLAAQIWQMQVLVSCCAESNVTNCLNLSNVVQTESVIVKNHLSDMTSRKRKVEEGHEINSIPKLSLDLNVSVEELEASGNEVENGNSKAWLEDFLAMIDQRVDFEPFNFDALASELVGAINSNFQKFFGSKVSLEIESRCMEQMLAAAWACNATDKVKVWIDKVLGRSFAEAQDRCRSSNVPSLKLVACGKFCSKEERFELMPLPARIVPIFDV